MARTGHAACPVRTDLAGIRLVVRRTATGGPKDFSRWSGQDSSERRSTMWDTVQDSWSSDHAGSAGEDVHLSHDRPCVRCGHAMHTFLACDRACGCEPASINVA